MSEQPAVIMEIFDLIESRTAEAEAQRAEAARSSVAREQLLAGLGGRRGK